MDEMEETGASFAAFATYLDFVPSDPGAGARGWGIHCCVDLRPRRAATEGCGGE